MSYPPPPPPGQGGPGPYPGPAGPGPYPGGGHQPNPYAAGPYGPPPKKDTTLWWILGTIAVVVILCCIGACGLFGWASNEAGQEIKSSSDSWSSSLDDAEAAVAQEVSEGSEVTDSGATAVSGWSVSSSGELVGVTLRNDGTSREMLRTTFFFMEGGTVRGTATCSSDFLDPGETDPDPSCSTMGDTTGYDEIRFAEGS